MGRVGDDPKPHPKFNESGHAQAGIIVSVSVFELELQQAFIVKGVPEGRALDAPTINHGVAFRGKPEFFDLFGIGQRINHTSFTGGNNLYPENYGFSLPYFKSTYSATDTVYRQHAMGQHVMNSHEVDCFGVGDCIFDSYYMRASGGFRDAADEGSHPADLQLTEDERVFQGVCASGCTTGSQVLQVTATLSAGTQGSGRFLIDKASAKTISTGQLVGGNQGAFPAATAQFAGTTFGASTFFFTAAAIPPQSNVMAPGTVTVGIQTSGVPAGFSTNTSSSPSGSGVACIADSISGGTATPQNYEMVPYTVVDGTHLRFTLNKPHGPAAIVSIGGLCGYGLEQTVDTVGGIRQVFPVIGTVNATNLYVASGLTSIVGRNQSTSNYLNLSYTVTSVARSGGVVTVTVTSPSALDTTGATMTLSGVTDSSFNGSFPVTLIAGNQFQFTQSGPDASSTGGTLQALTGGYVLYPMAEVLDVYDATTGGVTGKMTLAPNNVQWAANDPVEQPHYFQEKVSADVEYITQYTPRPNANQQAGLYYQGNNGPGLTGFVVANTATGYLGSGGTRQAPDTALQTQGTWTTALDMQAGEQTAIRLRCNSRGCGRFNSTYNLFQLDFVPGGSSYDKVTYAPQNGTMQWTLHGTQYTMSPTAMTVGTLNVTNLNATHINGGSGGTVNQATSTSQGIVQLGPQATSATLANVATSGSAGDLGGILAAAQTPAMNGDVVKAAGSGIAVVTGASNGLFKSGSSGMLDYPASSQASQDPSLWTSYAFTDSNIKVPGHAFAHGIADNNIFNRSASNCDILPMFTGGNFAGCAYAGFDARTSYQGANNFNHYVGFQAAGELASTYTGTTDQWYGFISVPKINGGTVNNVVGFRAANPGVAGSGTVKNAYGAYIDAQTAGTQSNYGLYVNQSASGNMLGGNTVVTPNYNGEGSLVVSNPNTGSGAWTGVEVWSVDRSHSFKFGAFGANWPSGISVLYPNSTYFGSAGGMTSGIVYNTETPNAPHSWGVNSTIGMTLDASRLSLSQGWVFHAALSTPASSTDTCSAGDFKDDANFHYVCVAANTWKRVALSAF